MPSTATLSRSAKPARAEANTYGLPRGEKLRRALVTVFRLQRQAILRYLRTGRKDLHEPIPTDWPDWNDFHLGALAVSERMTPILSLTWDDAATQFAPRVGLDPDSWEVVNPHTERMIEQAALDFCASTNDTTSLSLDEALAKTRDELHAGIVEKGEALPALTKRINAIFDGAERWRARRIAQTETSRAVHAAQEQAAIASGVVTGWAWLLSSDACPLCQTIARRAPAVRLGHAFAVIGNSHAYSQVRMPPAHPHCACSAIEILDTDIQPAWSDTLHQPQPEETDLTGPEAVPFSPQPAPVVRPKPPARPKPAARKKPAMLKGDALIEEAHSIMTELGVRSQSGTIAQIEAAMPNHYLTDKMPAVFDPRADKVWINTEAGYWANPAKVLKLSKQQKWFAVNTPEQVAYHEAVHALHLRSVTAAEAGDREKAIRRTGQMTLNEFPIPLRRTIQKKVGRYAALNESEFVAEVGGAIRQGKTYDDEIMALYRELLGP